MQGIKLVEIGSTANAIISEALPLVSHTEADEMNDLQLRARGASVQDAKQAIEARANPSAHPPASLEALELENRLKIRLDICRFLIKALGFSMVCCFILIFLQGFRPWGFQMDETFLEGLCGATIVQSVVFLGIFTKAVWGKFDKAALRSIKIKSKQTGPPSPAERHDG